MSIVTYYAAQSFEMTKRGRFAAGTAVEASSADQACRRAERLSQQRGGAVAFSRTGDPSIGEFEDAVIIAKYGDVPDDLMSA